MIERASGARLLLKPAQLLLGVRARRENLERHLAAQLSVPSGKHPTHAAAPDFPLDAIPLPEVGQLARSRPGIEVRRGLVLVP